MGVLVTMAPFGWLVVLGLTARYRLKDRLKGPVKLKTTNQPTGKIGVLVATGSPETGRMKVEIRL